ncbi:hypothetical protein AgCh_034293 [Apium graveolens]
MFENRDGIGFGLIARDSDCILIETMAEFKTPIVDPVLVKSMEIKEALSWIDKAQGPQVTLEFGLMHNDLLALQVYSVMLIDPK